MCLEQYVSLCVFEYLLHWATCPSVSTVLWGAFWLQHEPYQEPSPCPRTDQVHFSVIVLFPEAFFSFFCMKHSALQPHLHFFINVKIQRKMTWVECRAKHSSLAWVGVQVSAETTAATWQLLYNIYWTKTLCQFFPPPHWPYPYLVLLRDIFPGVKHDLNVTPLLPISQQLSGVAFWWFCLVKCIYKHGLVILLATCWYLCLKSAINLHVSVSVLVFELFWHWKRLLPVNVKRWQWVFTSVSCNASLLPGWKEEGLKSGASSAHNPYIATFTV